MAIEAISAASLLNQTTADELNARFRATGKSKLGAEDFLRLLTVQLQNQDPTKPMEDTAFIAQMASFTTLEQTQEMVRAVQQQSQMAAISYLGKEVTVIRVDGDKVSTVKGVVTGVTIDDGMPHLIVNGTPYPISSVKDVTLKPETTSGTPE